MKDLVIIFDMAKKLGYNLDALTLEEGIALKKIITTSIEQAIKLSNEKGVN